MFYANLQKEKFYQVDEEAIAKYFPTQHVVSETMAIYQELFGLRFERIDAQTWHEDVECYEVTDAEDGKLRGCFYLDLYPREGKFNHAAVFPLVKASDLRLGSKVHSAAAMVCNFKRPTADSPSTLYHGDVVTFFHEFGHVMHNICTKSNYSRFSGTSVERDFVELPSQMLENWVWHEDVLRRLSKHIDGGDSLPRELIEKKLAIKNLNEATFTLQQIFYGTYDIVLHTASDKATELRPGGLFASVR